MTDEELAAIRAKYESLYVDKTGVLVVDSEIVDYLEIGRKEVPRLLDEVERLQAENAKLQHRLEAVNRYRAALEGR